MAEIYTKSQYFLFAILSGFIWSSCNIVNPPEQTPTYVHIDSFIFNHTSASSVNTHQITNVWVYYNNNPVGAFDLPATVPIIATGSGSLELSPGITIDGLNSLTGVYPFYAIDTSTLVAQPGKIIDRVPHTQYYSSVLFHPISNFTSYDFKSWTDNGNIPFGSTAPIGHAPDSLVEPGYSSSGIIQLVAGVTDSSIDSNSIAFVIPTGAAFIEVDYKCDVPIQLGLQANVSGFSTTPYYLAGIYPSAVWQKFYLSVADFAGQYKGTTYNLYIRAVLPPGKATGRVLLNNIQLVHF
jgi:hypothetical protein